MQCNHCGAEVGSEYRLCPYCRTELEYPSQKQEPATIIINNVISNSNNISGVPNNQKSKKSKKKKTVALLLCIFGGYIGLHHFYVGKIGMGILYLFTAGLFCIGWIYDIFKILSGTFRDGLNLPIIE